MVESAAENPFCQIDETVSTLKLTPRNDDDQFLLKLKEKTAQSHDTYMFTFELPSPDQVLGLPVGGFLLFHAEIDGKIVTKRYTPISALNEKGVVRFIIKVYHKTEEFPSGGVFSQYLESLKPGEQVMVEGPKGLLNYQGNCKFLIKKKPITYPKLLLIAGGSGLTPCFQILQAATLGKDTLKIAFIYSNKTEDDILAKDLLDKFEAENDNLKLIHTLTRVPADGAWSGKKGRVNAGMCKSAIELDDDVLVAYCGPPGLNKCVEEICDELGIAKERRFKF